MGSEVTSGVGECARLTRGCWRLESEIADLLADGVVTIRHLEQHGRFRCDHSRGGSEPDRQLFDPMVQHYFRPM